MDDKSSGNISNSIWHTMPVEEIQRHLAVDINRGLDSSEAEQRYNSYGPNELEQKERRPIIWMFIDQFKDFMVLILIAAAIISAVLGETTDSIIILIIVILNAVLSVIQESKAESSLAALKKLAAPNAKTWRNNSLEVVPASKLVPGDIVLLEAGDFVPADIRLVETFSLKIEEAVLTGESVPVDKNIDIINDKDIALGDRLNMAYSSSIVSYGRGRGIVVATGMNTQVGQIAQMLHTDQNTQTPLQKKLETLGKTMGIAVIGICAVIFLVGISYGKNIFNMFLTSVSLAVAAIPEGLVAIVTIVLAIGVQRMIKRNAIIRKLPAVETLGSATVICSDKTGTLTQNKMTVEKVFTDGLLHDVSDLPKNGQIELLCTIGVSCNDGSVRNNGGPMQFIGDPTETALLELGMKIGFNKEEWDAKFPRIGEIPFDSERKLMSTAHKTSDGYRMYTKGAPDELLSRCKYALIKGNVVLLDNELLTNIQNANENMAMEALRVLGMAYKAIDNGEKIHEEDLIFVGLVAMIDPPRPEAAEAVKLCKKAGIKPVMITGDHKVTAVAIAKKLGIIGDESEAITGRDLQQMSDEDLKQNISRYAVYARVSPEHKVRIVRAWQEWGDVVAMTGDGVNDAPALRRADIGAAMGRIGTDVAKEAADMVLTDDNFATIVSAVEEGRTIFENIIKCIQFLLSCNIGEILVLFVATLFNWAEPLLPIHILWINLITDSLPALALGLEPAEADVMDRKPRDPNKGIFTKNMIGRIIYQGSIIGIITLIVYVTGKSVSIETGRTMAFAVLAFSQIVHGLNVRSTNHSIFKIGIFTNKYYVGAGIISLILQLSVLNIPLLSDIFKVVPLNSYQWVVIILLSLVPIPIVEVVKILKYHMFNEDE